jgi:predicted MFS family arabinose efflux permease
LLIAAIALAVVPITAIFLRNSPADLGMTPFGSPSDAVPTPPPRSPINPAKRAIQVLGRASKVRTFWALVAGFAICGATTNGLIGTHFIPSAHDAGMAEPVAAGLLAIVGIFDVVGTIASGYLTDRVNPRILLAIYYAGRGVSLLILPFLLSATVRPPIILFVVIYGLDWVATVPPTARLCREVFGEDGPVVYGWVFASHQIGASLAAVAAGVLRDVTGEYTWAWFGAAALCVVAAIVSVGIAKNRPVARLT